MITYDQAMTENNFFSLIDSNADKTPLRVRRNGKTQTWKTRPGQFSIPVKYGLKQCFNITQSDAIGWAVSSGDNQVDGVTAKLLKSTI